MHFIIQYIKHVLTATNQHGVHSPFVYDFVTKCLYKKTSRSGKKSEQVVLKSISYFSIERFKISLSDSQTQNQILKELVLKVPQEGLLDLLFIDQPQADVLAVYQKKIHNDTIIIIDNIHKTKDASNIWQKLSQGEKTTVSIDMFHCGLLCLRKEQVKEHFKIRI